jgi:hypothetical protein
VLLGRKKIKLKNWEWLSPNLAKPQNVVQQLNRTNAENAMFRNKTKQNMTSTDLLIEPNDSYLKIAKPTCELLQRVLAVIKACQTENIECEEYIKLSHSIIETFINQPLEK